MKIQRTISNKPLIIAAIVAATLLTAVGIAYVLNTWPFQENSDSQTINLEEPTDEQIKDGEATKERVIEESSDTESNETAEKEPTSPESTDSNDSLETSITVLEVNDQTLYVRNEIRGVYATGTCTLTLTKGTQTVTKTSGVQALAKLSTCKGFNVPTSELSQGLWQATLDISINGKSDTATDEVKI